MHFNLQSIWSCYRVTAIILFCTGRLQYVLNCNVMQLLIFFIFRGVQWSECGCCMCLLRTKLGNQGGKTSRETSVPEKKLFILGSGVTFFPIFRFHSGSSLILKLSKKLFLPPPTPQSPQLHHLQKLQQLSYALAPQLSNPVRINSVLKSCLHSCQ